MSHAANAIQKNANETIDSRTRPHAPPGDDREPDRRQDGQPELAQRRRSMSVGGLARAA